MALQAEWKNIGLKVGLRNKEESSVAGAEWGRGQAKELRLQRARAGPGTV